MTNLKDDLIRLLSQGKADKVIEVLLSINFDNTSQSEIKNEVVLQSARLRNLMQSRRTGTINLENENAIQNQINTSLLSIINSLTEENISSSKIKIPSSKNNNRLLFYSILMGVVVILSLIFFLPKGDNVTTDGEQSPAVKSEGDVNVEYNNYDGGIVVDKNEPKYDLKEKNKLRKANITYEAADGSAPIFEKLFGVVDGQKYELITESDELCVNVADQRDFDGNGSIDALVTNIIACGGNCCGDSYFFYSYSGDGHFQQSGEFGYSWSKPKIEKWKGRWSVVVTSINEGINTQKFNEIKERYVLDAGEAVKIEETERKGLSTLTEINSNEFDMDKEEIKYLNFDLDGNGLEDRLRCGLWTRWGRIVWTVEWDNGTKTEVKSNCKRVGILPTKTKGVHDIVCDLDGVLIWDGEKYVNKN